MDEKEKKYIAVEFGVGNKESTIACAKVAVRTEVNGDFDWVFVELRVCRASTTALSCSSST